MANGLFNLKQVMQGIQQGGWSNQVTPAVEYLVVAGGGGGGNGGGGGAGGLLAGISSVPNGQALLVTVGSGGNGSTTAAAGVTGGNSVFGKILANGGGGGSGYQTNGAAGGSGGGGGRSDLAAGTVGGAGTSGQGNSGGNGLGTSNNASGGGGGAGTIGRPALISGYSGIGGAGASSAISGTVTTYAGGGGGYGATGGAAAGGAGGGGTGANGTANTGGGGAGGSGTGYNGGSGIVIVSYPDVYAAPTATTGSPTVSTSGSGSFLQVSNSLGFGFAGQSQFVFGTGDFTIELWAYVTDFSGFALFADFRSAGSTGNGPHLYCNTSGGLIYATNGTTQITGATLSTSTWYHIAVCRIGTSTKMYLNGTQTGSTYTDSTNYVCGATGPHFLINCDVNAGAVIGNATNIRVVKGVGVYTGTFTPSTVPLQATQSAGTNIAAITGTQTSLLLNSVSGAYLADSSTNSFIATNVVRPPTWNASSPFTGTGYKNRVYTWTSSGSITF